ncbi:MULTISPECIES: YwqG family protein [Bacillus]|uniref:YwqG family protein n=1 Tax=Bacillus TaxID=1386 RepID=UPI0004248E10|nr:MULTISPECIES: YwqG family protein [Bacillus]QHZ45353.1 DUF1963 domain-containing protein [Bacillus sp. NSP9.1]WFA04851.1 YwqG family protein [Bacillus sp. HSf4]
MEKAFPLPEKMAGFRGQFEKSARDYLNLKVKKAKTGRYDSKLAGDPYFPKSERYPVDSQGKPMKLLAQINFSEMPQLEHFPDSGILLFFISVSDDVYGLNFDNPCEQTSFCIKYFEDLIDDEAELVTDFSFVKLEDELQFPIGCEASIIPEKRSELVSPADFQFEQYAGLDVWSFFEQFGDQEEAVFEEYHDMHGDFSHKIGGYACFTQTDPRIYDNGEHTMLLLQIDSDDDIDAMWGDVGIANFFIRPDDLKKKDFSNVLYHWDCC